MKNFTRSVMTFLLCATSGYAGAQQTDASQLADQAFSVLKSRCYRCHGGAAKNAGLDVLNRRNLLELKTAAYDMPAVTPANSDESSLWQSISDEFMPQTGSAEAEEMTADEQQVLKQWIDAGAPAWQVREFTFVSNKDVLIAIRSYLLDAPAEDQGRLRFYSFTHLHNNPEVTALDLRLYRAALVKVVNSLSWEREPVMPVAVPGTQDSVFAINLKVAGWDKRNLWFEVLQSYPYGLKYDYVRDEETKKLAGQVTLLSGGDLPYVRADWFVVTASQPPLYHTMLDIPERLGDLEERLGIDFEQKFGRGDVQRAGFATSGVSKQNRLIERMTSSQTPYYWISYDFKPRKAKSDIVRFPLGPRFEGNRFNKAAFDHDGGEIIFSLPNGMQAYMLIDNKGNRINSGPVDVVFDRAAILGTPEIINGISCMHCHRHGMISDFRDEVRGAEALRGEVADKVDQIYPPAGTMARDVTRDRDVFLRALQRMIGPTLQAADDRDKPLESFPEPVSRVAQLYSRDLKPHEVALELGIEKLDDLQIRVRGNRELLRLGLGTLFQDPPGTLKREKWETVDGTSLYQDVAVELRLGTPIRPGSVTD